jgi:adenylate cyclase
MKRHEHALYWLTRRLECGTLCDVAIAGRSGGVAARDVFPVTIPGVAKLRGAEASDHRGALRRLRLLSGLVMFAYIATHLVNHALGIISLALAESGLRRETAFWRGTMPTIALYGAAATHFSLVLWTLYHRREWRLPAIEILRLASGFSFPLLLFGHAVTTRLGEAVFGTRPSYGVVIKNLLMAGKQGMQLALLAPGWVHGFLGLWITLRRFHPMQEIRHWLILLVVLVPLLAAGKFFRMASKIVALRPPPPISPDAAIARETLAAWQHDLTIGYLGAVFAAFVLGRMHVMVRRSN